MNAILKLLPLMVLLACSGGKKNKSNGETNKNLPEESNTVKAMPDQQKNDTIQGLYIIHLTREYSEQAVKAMGGSRNATESKFKLQYLKDILSYAKINDTSLITGALKYVFYAKLDSSVIQYLLKDKRVQVVKPCIIKYPRLVTAVACTPTTEKQWGVQYIWGVNEHNNGDYGTAWILDTGVDPGHSDLNLTLNITFVPGATLTDKNGHGTLMAGIIGAKKNGAGVVGVAPNASLKSIKIYSDNGAFDSRWYHKALEYVLNNGVKGNVLNLSLEGEDEDPTETNYIKDIAKKGIYVSIAAGNNSKDVENDVYPATINAPNVFTVSAMDKNKNYCAFSNFGKISVDYCSPGKEICSTWPGNIYKSDNGTSEAAAHLSGLLLLKKGVINSIEKVKGDPDGIPDKIIHE